MKVTLAKDYGMCFGVRDALAAAENVALKTPATMLGQLVHNPVVSQRFARLGVTEGRLEAIGDSLTHDVIITAHGAADRDRAAWRDAGFRVTDTSCPLVRKAHHALAELVACGYHPVVIGQRGHVEVRGLTGDFPGASVVLCEADLADLPEATDYGVVSQTTQPLELVLGLVKKIREWFPGSGVHFRDTVCHPTKQRQKAMDDLCRENEVIIVVGGRNSNNSRQLVEKARALGRISHLVEGAADLQPEWIAGAASVGVTAGTSTLEETVQEVMATLRAWAYSNSPSK